MREIDCLTWKDFDRAIADIERRCKELEAENSGGFETLYRGLGNQDWGLQTTLERAVPFELAEPLETVAQYYRYAFSARAAIKATYPVSQWDDIPSPDQFDEAVRQFLPSRIGLEHFIKTEVRQPVYRYFAHLRHHGYPSPLLDWTASADIAAFFAFDGMDPKAARVAIYAVLLDWQSSSAAGQPRLTLLGPHVDGGARHEAQKSSYTICTIFDSDFRIYSHDAALKDRDGLFGIAGEAIRILVPAWERSTALKALDEMNINPHSLYGSEDSLMKTIARREGIFRK